MSATTCLAERSAYTTVAAPPTIPIPVGCGEGQPLQLGNEATTWSVHLLPCRSATCTSSPLLVSTVNAIHGLPEASNVISGRPIGPASETLLPRVYTVSTVAVLPSEDVP